MSSLNTTPKLTAAERRAALIAERDALAAHRDAVQSKRDSLPPSDPGWRRANKELREVADELDGYAAAIAALAPEIEAETREAHHARAVADHARAVEAAEKATILPARMDKLVSELCALYANYAEWWPRCASAANVDPNPLRLDARMPTREAMAEVVLARLVGAGILDRDHLPQRFEDDPIARDELRRAGLAWPGHTIRSSLELAAEASFVRDVHEPFKRAIAEAAPDRRRREREYLAEIARERAAREAAELAKPLPKLPAPAPVVHTISPPVIGR